MEPITGPYLHDVFTGEVARRGILGQSIPYDPNRSLAENALDPAAIEAAMNVALGFGPGAIKSVVGLTGHPLGTFADEAGWNAARDAGAAKIIADQQRLASTGNALGTR